MVTKLNNTASVLGEYNVVPTSVNFEVLVVSLISESTVNKSANKMVWADGTLIFNIEVDNQTEKSYMAPVITDALDINIVSFVAGSA